MKVALVYDRVNKFGGAERVLLALHEIWPDAPLYTAVYDPAGAPWAGVFDVRPSFLQHVAWARTHHEWLAPLTPMAFESFSFDGYDIVISVTSAEAKAVITKPQTMHVCYCLTPTRYLWSSADLYQESSFGGFGRIAPGVLRWLSPKLRRWDLVASRRPDYYLAISRRVRERIRRYYHREVADLIYPPTDVQRFVPGPAKQNGDYFLLVSRLVAYKRIDIVVDAFNQLGYPLIIIGSGSEESSLKRRAKGNVSFLTRHLTDEELVSYYQSCRAFVFAADEDFGVAGVEALSCGKPVVAFGQSGMAEYIEEGKTGITFGLQEPSDLVAAVQKLDHMHINSTQCRQRAEAFSSQRFAVSMRRRIEGLYSLYTKHL